MAAEQTKTRVDEGNSGFPSGTTLTPIARRIVCIGGFLQAEHGATGMERVWQQLRERHESPGCHVSIHPWNDDWAGFVGHLLRTGPRDVSEFDIRIVAYSWGVGYGAITLARLLQQEGITVRRLMSCDGVYYSRFARWRALWSPISDRIFGQPRIRVPANVRVVASLRQTHDRPAGSQFQIEDRTAQVVLCNGVLEHVGHTAIDNSPQFLKLALQGCAP